IEQKAYRYSGERDEPPEELPIPAELQQEFEQARDRMLEKLGEIDEQIMISYIEGHPVTTAEIHKALRRATLDDAVTPVLCGSALKNKGVPLLLDAVVEYLPSPIDIPAVPGTNTKSGEEEERAADENEPFTALVFKIVTDPYVGRLAYARIYSGK